MEATEPPVITGKKWYTSRTLWVMGIALLATIAQAAYGFIIAPDEELAIVTVIGLCLRAITKEPLV